MLKRQKTVASVIRSLPKVIQVEKKGIKIIKGSGRFINLINNHLMLLSL